MMEHKDTVAISDYSSWGNGEETMMEHKASVTIKSTGEVIQLPLNTDQEIGQAYEQVEERLAAYRTLRKQILERGMLRYRKASKGVHE